MNDMAREIDENNKRIMREVLLRENLSFRSSVPSETVDAFKRKIEKYGSLLDKEYALFCDKLNEKSITVFDKDIDKDLIQTVFPGEITPEKIKVFQKYATDHLLFAMFFNERLEYYLNEIKSLIESSEHIYKKREQLEKSSFIYDVLRWGGFGLYKELIGGKTHYVYNSGEEIDYRNEFDRLDSLTMPYDYRACEMFFGMYRILGDRDKLNWCIFYIYLYLNKLFYSFWINEFSETVDLRTEGIIYSESPEITKILRLIKDGLDRQISKLGNVKDHDHEFLIDEYRICNTVVIGQLREEFKNNDGESSLAVALKYALSYALIPLSFLIDILNYVIEEKKDDFVDEIETLEELSDAYHDLRGQILKYTYKHYRVFDREYNKVKLESIIRAEDEQEKSFSRVEKICDLFERILYLQDENTIENMMKKKRELSVQLCEESVFPQHAVERLDKCMDSLVDTISKNLTDKNDNIQNLKEINGLLATKERFEQFKLDEFKTMLSSAEFLYGKYVDGKEEKEELDYSFVALLYYKALESLLNNCFYIPYVNEYFICNEHKSFDKTYFTEYFNKESIEYLTNRIKGSYSMKKSCELGKMGRVLEGDNPQKFYDYFKNKLGIEVINGIKDFGKKISDVAPKRNKAAHGTKVVSLADAVTAKNETYALDEYRGLIYEFIKMVDKG